MLTLKDLKFDTACLGRMLLVEVKPVREYQNNKPTDKILGYRYYVTLPDKMFEKLGVRIEGEQLMEQPESYAEVLFENLEINAYSTKEGIVIAATATGIKPVQRKA